MAKEKTKGYKPEGPDLRVTIPFRVEILNADGRSAGHTTVYAETPEEAEELYRESQKRLNVIAAKKREKK